MGKTRETRVSRILSSVMPWQLGLLRMLVFLMTLVGWSVPSVFGADDDAARVVATLEHVCAEYGQPIFGRDRYARYRAEQLSLLDTLAPAVHAMLPQLPDGVKDLERLRREVLELQSVELVTAHGSRLAEQVAAAHALDRLPAAVPDFARGQALYVAHCASCHGRFGEADTDRARSLDPPPASFVGRALRLSPRRAWETVSFGVPGTAMVAHAFLNAEERWDLAFYVSALRHRERASTPAPTFAPAELAVLDDVSLAEWLSTAGSAKASLPGMLANLRTRQTFATPSGATALGRVRDGLVRARQALTWGDREVASRGLAAAHIEGLWPGLERLDGVQSSAASEVDERLTWLCARVHSEPPAESLRDVDTLLMLATTAELRALAAPSPTFLDELRFGARSVLPACLGLLALLLGRPRKERVAAALGVALAALATLLIAAGLALHSERMAPFFPWLRVGSLGVALAAILLRFAPKLPRFTARSDVVFVGAWALGFAAGDELARHALTGVAQATPLPLAGMLFAVLTGGVTVGLGCGLPGSRRSMVRRVAWLLCALPVVARLAGDLAWSLLHLGWLRGGVYAWAGTPALGVHPAALPLLALAAALAATAFLGLRRFEPVS